MLKDVELVLIEVSFPDQAVRATRLQFSGPSRLQRIIALARVERREKSVNLSRDIVLKMSQRGSAEVIDSARLIWPGRATR
jgi:hypothetical protein